MRRVLIDDVAVVARVLLATPPSARTLRLARLITMAEAADAHRSSTGRAHPRWGSGSLMAAASGMQKVPPPDFDDEEVCSVWMMILAALVAHRSRQAGG